MVARIGHQSCWRVIATVVLNGETLQTAQACSDKPNTDTPTGRYEKTGLERTQSVLNRKVGYRVWVSPRNAQRGGRRAETSIKSDSPSRSRNPKCYVKFNVILGGRSLSMTGLSAALLEA